MPNYRDWLERSTIVREPRADRFGGPGLQPDRSGRSRADPGPPRHRELLPGARRPADAGPHVPARNEEDAGRDRVVVLSHGLWTRRYAADPAIVGKHHPDRRQGARRRRRHARVVRLRLRHPPRAVGAGRLDGAAIRTATSHSFIAIGRLKPGVTMEQARSEMDTIGRALSAEYPLENAEPDRRRRADERVRPAAEAIAAVADAGGGGVRAADCLRQRRQPDCWRGRRRDRASWPSAPRSAPAAGASCGSC